MSRPALADLPERFDLVVIGGGITGAGIFREAVRTGARVLLVERDDFASGTSSASSKLVHGGLRYLRTGQWRLTLESVRERRRLLREAAGLVDPLPFLMPVYRGRRPGRWTLRAGLGLYDLMAGQRRSRWADAASVTSLEGGLRGEELLGGMLYEDAQTDDARLVLRLVQGGCADGGVALNHCEVTGLRNASGLVAGVTLQDASGTRELSSSMVINATGVWAGTLEGAPAGAPALRPLRGSHLVFPRQRLPVSRAVSWLHPGDGRPVFCFPWEGAVVLGTTDLDHEGDPSRPRMISGEAWYLMEALNFQFPNHGLSIRDVTSCYAGVRPVVAGGRGDPSAESRESAMWESPGLVGVTGGKLTTFRVTARQTLARAARQVRELAPAPEAPLFGPPAGGAEDRRLLGRLGAEGAAFVSARPEEERRPLGTSPYTIAELRWSARSEWVGHLDDLLLRRTRIGLVEPEGGQRWLPQVEPLCRVELGWDAERWAAEQKRYLALWLQQHSVAMMMG